MEEIYMLIEREFIKTEENIYKIGKTKKTIKHRLKQYPKNSKLIISKNVKNCDVAEKILILEFKKQFAQRKDIGREYFEGDIDDMINLFNNVALNYDKYSITKNNDKKIKVIKIDINGDMIANIDEAGYNLDELQKMSELDVNDMLVLNKIVFNKTFGINCTKNIKMFAVFYNNFCDKIAFFNNFEKFFDYITSDNLNDKLRHNIILDLIKRLTGKDINCIDDLIDVKINNKDYVNAVYDIAKNSIYFKDENKNRALFLKSKKDKMKLENDKDLPIYTRFLQNILADYAISLSVHRVRVGKIRVYNYKLSVNMEFKKIADFKHNKVNSIDIYNDLFIKK